MANLRGTIDTLQFGIDAASRVDAAMFLPRCADQCTHEGGVHIGVTETYLEVIVDYELGIWTYGIDELTLPIVGALPKGVELEV